MQLTIDTSTNYAGLALVRGSDIIAELAWRCGQNHTVELFPHLDFLLEKHNPQSEALDCIFVAKGPGSFNGLRVGISAAKGLAFSLGIPIIAISTLEATAYQHSGTGIPVCAIQHAGREEVAAAVYQKRPRKGWSQIVAEHITTLQALLSLIKGPTIFCGEFDEPTSLRIKKLSKTFAVFPPPAGQVRRAAYLAELGQQRLRAGQYDNLSTLQPLYLRRPPITERKKPY